MLVRIGKDLNLGVIFPFPPVLEATFQPCNVT